MTIDCTTIATRLAEANAAYHDLATGKAVSEISTAGETTRYIKSDGGMTALKAYIADLLKEKASCDAGATSQAYKPRNAIKPGFGG